jgi:hypothetical protein
MSWDVLIMPADSRQSSEGAKPQSLGDAAQVRAKISKTFPAVNWKDPALGVLQGNGWTIEFNHQATGKTDSIMLNVRGGGDPIASIVKLCKDNGWAAWDGSSGELLNLDAPSAKSWQEFQGYRDQVIASTGRPAESPKFVREHPGLFVSAGILVLVVVMYMAWKSSWRGS